MKLQQRRFLDAVVRNNLNVSAAAEELYTSQPGVSHQIRLLEDELEIQIFERSGKKLTALSPAGHAIMGHVNELLNSARNIEQAAREYSRRARHLSACQYDFLHLVAPHIDMDTIRAVAAARTLQQREKLLRQAQVPNFSDLRASLKLQAVG